MGSTADTDELVSFLVRSLVEHPDDVRVVRRQAGEHSVVFEVTVHSDDVGKIIGRQGRMIRAIRTIVRAAASLDDADASVEVIG